jgi:hypothetical protein
MLTDTLFCRVIALPFDDFERVAGWAGEFAGTARFPDAAFSRQIVWNETISFGMQPSAWSSGVPACEIGVQLALVRLGVLDHADAALFGVLSPLASLSSAYRNHLQRRSEIERLDIAIDLNAVLADWPYHGQLQAYGYGTGLHARAVLGQNLSPHEALSAGEKIDALTIGGKTGPLEITATMDLTLASTPDIEGAMEDIRQAFDLVAPSVRIAGAALGSPTY